jgi:thiamine pyrophosphokinase
MLGQCCQSVVIGGLGHRADQQQSNFRFNAVSYASGYFSIELMHKSNDSHTEKLSAKPRTAQPSKVF